MKKLKVFLGGTCVGYNWRKYMIPQLKCDYFNPLVDDWTEECYQRELIERKECDYVLYVITSAMEGVYSIAEVVDDSNKQPKKTILCILKDGFTVSQTKSLNKVEEMVTKNGGTVLGSLEEVITLLNISTDPSMI